MVYQRIEAYVPGRVPNDDFTVPEATRTGRYAAALLSDEVKCYNVKALWRSRSVYFWNERLRNV